MQTKDRGADSTPLLAGPTFPVLGHFIVDRAITTVIAYLQTTSARRVCGARKGVFTRNKNKTTCPTAKGRKRLSSMKLLFSGFDRGQTLYGPLTCPSRRTRCSFGGREDHVNMALALFDCRLQWVATRLTCCACQPRPLNSGSQESGMAVVRCQWKSFASFLQSAAVVYERIKSISTISSVGGFWTFLGNGIFAKNNVT